MYVDDAADILSAPYVILGATGFGLYQLFDSQAGAFPAFFDWIVLDEASQMLMPQALLSLVYGKGQYIFCGDVQQLPPVVLGPQPAQERANTPCADAVAPAALPAQSILAHLLTTYGPEARVRLNTTYRLNQGLCELPSQLWYQGDLHPATANATRHLEVPVVQQPDLVDAILAPQHPVTLVLADHTTDAQQSALEVEIVATLAARLLLDYGIAASRLAILAPHRAQNSAIAQRLAQLLAQRRERVTLPVIDTVERLQGRRAGCRAVLHHQLRPGCARQPLLKQSQSFQCGDHASASQTDRGRESGLLHPGATHRRRFTGPLRLQGVLSSLSRSGGVI